MNTTEINLAAGRVSGIVYGTEDNADPKAYLVHARVNPGLEDCINKLITQYFCTCVIPIVMLKSTVGGNQGVLWSNQGIDGFLGDFIVLLSVCICPCVCVCLRVRPRSAARGVSFLHV